MALSAWHQRLRCWSGFHLALNPCPHSLVQVFFFFFFLLSSSSFLSAFVGGFLEPWCLFLFGLLLLPDPALLSTFFRVSPFSVEKKPARDDQEEIIVSKSGQGKCPRCWNWAVPPHHHTGGDEGVCPRCAAALSSR